MSTAEERMQNEIDELEQENRLLRARNERLEREGEMRRLALLDIMQAEPVQEPVAWIRQGDLERLPFTQPTVDDFESGIAGGQQLMKTILSPKPHNYYGQIPLYTAQRQWVGLTDESVVSAAARVLSDRVAASCNVDCGDMWMLHGNDSIEDARAMLEAAEAKLKEKNTC